jgi:hypothetical protein
MPALPSGCGNWMICITGYASRYQYICVECCILIILSLFILLVIMNASIPSCIIIPGTMDKTGISAGGSGVKINNTFILVIPMMQGRKVKKAYMLYKKLVVTVFVGVLVLC